MIIMGGGAGRSPLVQQIMADTTGLTVAQPRTSEPVLLGAAMLGAVAAGAYASLGQTMASMSALGHPTEPAGPGMREFHRRKREVYGLLRGLDRGSRETMRGFDVKGG
jgi:D-ribulokinase